MRVTGNTFPNRLNVELQALQELLVRDQTRIASGQDVISPSDDPVAFRRAIQTMSSQLRVQEFRGAAVDVRSRYEQYLSAATSVQTLTSRASELAIRATGVLSQGDLDTIAAEIDSLLEEAVTLGNRQFQSQFLFGGTYLQPSDTDPATGAAYVPFSVTRSAANEITTVTYRGNTTVSQIGIDETSTIANNILGSSVTGIPRGLFINGAVNVFTPLITIRDQLRTGNNEAVLSPGIDNLRLIQDNVAVNIGIMASTTARLTLMEGTHTERLLLFEDTISDAVDADFAETAVHLQQLQTSFEAALQAGGRVLELSLLDFV